MRPPSPPLRAQWAGAGLLLAYGIGLTLWGAPVVRYAQAAAAQVLQPDAYMQAARERAPQIREPSP